MAGRGSEAVGCPPEVMAAIPWYPDDLSREEREAVDSHAAECLDCRRELEARLADPEAEWPMPRPEQTFTRILARVELTEAESLREWARAPRRTRAVRWLREREVHVPGMAKPVSAARGLVASFGALLAAAMLLFGAGPNGAPDPTPAPIVREAPHVDVVFREDITSAEIAGALEGIRGEIVSGPTARGRYRIALPFGSNAESAAQALVDANVAIYAEPVDP